MLLPYWAAVSANVPDPTMVAPHHEGDATDGDGGGSGDGDGDCVDVQDGEAVTDAGPGRKEMVMFTLKPSGYECFARLSVKNMKYMRAPGVVEINGPGRLVVRFPVRRMGLGKGTASGSRYTCSVS
jgi:hypothetical protein